MKPYLIVFLCTIGLLTTVTTVCASEGASGWRNFYDLAMKWVNFAILAFLLIKFLKDPFRNYFSEQKAELSKKIDTLEKEKEEKIRSIDNARKELEGSNDRLAALKKKIIHRGEREKEAMIKTAQDQSRLLLESAQRKVAFRIEQAKAKFRAELVDTAIDTAMKHLPAQMTDKDNKKLLQLFLHDLQIVKKY